MYPVKQSAARDLVMAHGWNATAYQILNPGIEHWFSPEGDAVVGYASLQRFMTVAGAPICAEQKMEAAAAGFEEFARERGRRVCYVCAEDRFCRLLGRSRRYAAVAIGAQPVWDPRDWPSLVARHASIRAQLNRARNKGVVIEPMEPASGARDPALRAVLDSWLLTRHLPPLHFLVESNTLGGIVRDRMLLVARHESHPIAFLVASPIPARAGYLIEQIVRDPTAPNGASELLIDAAMRQFASAGCAFVTLGLVALSRCGGNAIAANPLWLRILMRFARLHANRFYNFRGLEHFRLKLMPTRWETVWAISNERRFSIGALYAIGQAFAATTPWRALAIAAIRAARQELTTIGVIKSLRRPEAMAALRQQTRIVRKLLPEGLSGNWPAPPAKNDCERPPASDS
jgi:phosphatidylglycerol lysyltransferase